MDNIIQLKHSYRKIKASYKYAPEGLYRTFLVRSDLNLAELGCVLCTMFHAEYEHCFLFHTSNASYVPAAFLDGFADSDWLLMDDYSLNDLPDSFTFEYDTGESWEFKCKVYKKEDLRAGSQLAVLIDGAGAGLWEDASMEFLNWLAGDISPKKKHGPEDAPWNLTFKTYGELAEPLDLAKEQEAFDARIEDDMKNYLEGMAEYMDRMDDDMDYDDEEDGITDLVCTGAAFQIENVPFVRDTYARLLKKYTADEAFEMIASELALQIGNAITQENAYGNESYKKALERLK